MKFKGIIRTEVDEPKVMKNGDGLFIATPRRAKVRCIKLGCILYYKVSHMCVDWYFKAKVGNVFSDDWVEPIDEVEWSNVEWYVKSKEKRR
ncbi:MAG: hypothetical protein DRJ47_06745 [Thermoprotei archaeon]|nr:MAG: hypothetical protein DRJ47_06745 [Thermoprotei archaeon]